jgi:hypothetical protein
LVDDSNANASPDEINERQDAGGELDVERSQATGNLLDQPACHERRPGGCRRAARLRTTTQGRAPMPDESGHMWVITTDARHAIYNLAAFEVVIATQDVDRGTWSVEAADRDGERAVLLARTESQEQANDIVQHIADRLTALDLRPQ